MAKTDDIIVGVHPILEALKAGKAVNRVFIKKGNTGEQIAEVANTARKHEVPVQYVPVEKLNKLFAGTHQGVVAVVSPIEYYNLEELVMQVNAKGEKPLFLLLDQITDVRNFGAIARSAECAGVHGIVIQSKGGISITADAIKVSAGALNRIPVCRTPAIIDAVRMLQSFGVSVVAASEKGSDDYFNVIQNQSLGIVMGSEQKGIARQILKEVDGIASIPLQGEIGSLNVGVACGVLLFEAVRKRMEV